MAFTAGASGIDLFPKVFLDGLGEVQGFFHHMHTPVEVVVWIPLRPLHLKEEMKQEVRSMLELGMIWRVH